MKIFLTLAVLLTTALASGQEPLPEPLPKPLPKQVPPTQNLTQEPTHIQAPDRPPDQNHDWTSRTVTYEPQDIVTIPTQIRFTTIVVLPETETIVDFVVGDKSFWVVEGIENFAYIKPSKAGASTNVTLITATGKLYSLVVHEVSELGGTPDLKVFIVDKETEPAAPRPPRFVPIEEAESLREALTQIAEEAEKDKERFRREYGQKLHFVYEYKRNERPFFVTAIYHDGRFTYIRSDAQELPALYEYKDDNRTLNLVNFQMEKGLYVVAKIMDRGRLSIGKKHLDFERVN